MNMFNKEKSSKTVVILQVITLIFYFLTFVLLITAAGLFGKGQSIVNEDIQTEVCFLFFAEDNDEPSTANCGYAIAGEVLAAIGLGILLAIGIVKMVIGLMKLVFKFFNKITYECSALIIIFFRNDIFLLIDIILLVITSVFAITAAIVISAGVGVACKR